MALTLDISKAIRKLTSMSMYVPVTTTPFSQTLAAATTQSATVFSVGATTNATVGDPVVLAGPGGVELVTIGTPATEMPITNQRIHFIHPSATTIARQMVEVPLGKIAKGTAKMTGARPVNPFYSDVDDAAVGFLEGNEEYGAAFGLYEASPEAIQRLFGKTPVIIGDASASNPEQGALGDPNAPAPPAITVVRARGLLHGGLTFEIDFLDARLEPQIDSPLDGRDAPPSFNTNVRARFVLWRVKA